MAPRASGLTIVVRRTAIGGARNRIPGVSQAADHGARPVAARTTGATLASAWSSGTNPHNTMPARTPAGTSKARRAGVSTAAAAGAVLIGSADDASGIAVLDSLRGSLRTPPHLRVKRRQEPTVGVLAAANRREVDPGHRRVLVVREVPVVVHPQQIDRRPDPEVARTF